MFCILLYVVCAHLNRSLAHPPHLDHLKENVVELNAERVGQESRGSVEISSYIVETSIN